MKPTFNSRTSAPSIRTDSFVAIRKQRGVVLLVVIMLVFLMVTLLAFMVEDQYLLLRRVSNQNVAEQGYQYAQGANAWAMRLLYEDADRAADHAKDDWARIGQASQPSAETQQRFSLDASGAEEPDPLPTIDFGDVDIDFFVMDLQGLYNLNNLAVKNPKSKAAHKLIFYNLLELIGITELELKDQLYDSLVDWIDTNDLELPNGMESGNYASTDIPYYAADQKLSSLGELRFVNGFTPQIIADLEPYVTVLPAENVAININAASAEVLASLSGAPVMGLGAVTAFVQFREQPEFLGYTSADISLAENAIIQSNTISPTPPVPGMLAAASQFYQINVKVTLDKSVYCMRTKVFRDAGKANATMADSMHILHREYDSLCLNHRPIVAVSTNDLP